LPCRWAADVAGKEAVLSWNFLSPLLLITGKVQERDGIAMGLTPQMRESELPVLEKPEISVGSGGLRNMGLSDAKPSNHRICPFGFKVKN